MKANLAVSINGKEAFTLAKNEKTKCMVNSGNLVDLLIEYRGLISKNERLQLTNVTQNSSHYVKITYDRFLGNWLINSVPESQGREEYNSEDYKEIASFTETSLANNIVTTEESAKDVNQSSSQIISDVDTNIPVSNQENSLRFALIIGNEDYSSHQIDLSSEVNVDFARRDASVFKEYAQKTMGIPENNIIFLLDGTTGQMKQAISKANLIIKNTKGNAEFIVYYAGHGLPDEVSKEAYIMPVDVTGKNAADGIKLKDMYEKLLEFPSRNVTVFIDACFSGGARNQGLLVARGVKIKPQDEILKGNIVVFSACSGDQSALPYKTKGHGLFTYFLLKKIKESEGKVAFGELSEYVKDQVSLQSVLVNDKEQIPQTILSSQIQTEWEKYVFINK